LKGIEQQAIGNSIVRNTPKDIELAAIRQKYPGMTQGVPLENLNDVWRKLTHDEQNVARITDAKSWDPREFPDQGLAYRPKSIEREMEDAATPSHIGFAPRGRDPIQPGITHSYQPNEQAKALGTVIAALNDPRNAAIGGPMAGTIRGLGALRNRLFKPIGPETGGFRVPTSEMYRPLGAVRPNVHKLEVPSTEQGLRADYLGQIRGMNGEARMLREGGSLEPVHSDPNMARALTNVVQGQNDLSQLTKIQPFTQSAMEGAAPPEMLRRMGFVNNQSMAELDKIRREAQQWFSGKER
jgi:hypothetical protein